jgi:hypothetical protein
MGFLIFFVAASVAVSAPIEMFTGVNIHSIGFEAYGGLLGTLS